MEDNQEIALLNQLRSLSTFHYILGILVCLLACIPLLHLTFGLLFQFVPPSQDTDTIIFRGVGLIFMAVGSVLFASGQALGISIIISGKYLQRPMKYHYSLVVAAIECLFFPFGTILGIFTLILLTKPSVKALYRLEF